MFKKGDKVEIRIRGEVMEDERSPDSAIPVRCLLMRPSQDIVYSTFVLPGNILPLSPEGQAPNIVHLSIPEPNGLNAE